MDTTSSSAPSDTGPHSPLHQYIPDLLHSFSSSVKASDLSNLSLAYREVAAIDVLERYHIAKSLALGSPVKYYEERGGEAASMHIRALAELRKLVLEAEARGIADIGEMKGFVEALRNTLVEGATERLVPALAKLQEDTKGDSPYAFGSPSCEIIDLMDFLVALEKEREAQGSDPSLYVVDAFSRLVIRRLRRHFDAPPVDDDNDAYSSDENEAPRSDGATSPLSSTNRLDRPEWFYRHCRTILSVPSGPVAFFDTHLQPLLSKRSLHEADPAHGLIFRMVQLGRKRARDSMKNILKDEFIFWKWIEKSVSFEEYLEDEFGYHGPTVTSVFAETRPRLTRWVKLEARVGMESLDKTLSSPTAWNNRLSVDTGQEDSLSIKVPIESVSRFQAIIKGLCARTKRLPLPLKSAFIANASVPLAMRFYDAIYALAKDNDVRDARFSASDPSQVEDVSSKWCCAIEGAESGVKAMEVVGEGCEKIKQSFAFLRSALVKDLVKGMYERGRELTHQYLLRSHNLLKQHHQLDALASLADPSKPSRPQSREPHCAPDPSPDLVAALTFYAAAAAAVDAFASAELAAELRGSLAEEVSRSFLDRVMDAPIINRDGRRQFCFDVSTMLGIFDGGVGVGGGRPEGAASMLRSALVVLSMPEEGLASLKDVIADVREGGGETEELQAASMLEAKGVNLPLETFLGLCNKIG